MTIISDISRLNKEQLIDALMYTRVVDSTYRTRSDIKAYYSMLSLEELQQKASELLFKEDRTLTSVLEMKRRQILIDKVKYVAPIVIINVESVVKSTRTAQQELIAELQIKRWVKDVVEVCNGVVGVKLRDDKKKTIKAIVRRVGFKGDIIYG